MELAWPARLLETVLPVGTGSALLLVRSLALGWHILLPALGRNMHHPKADCLLGHKGHIPPKGGIEKQKGHMLRSREGEREGCRGGERDVRRDEGGMED